MRVRSNMRKSLQTSKQSSKLYIDVTFFNQIKRNSECFIDIKWKSISEMSIFVIEAQWALDSILFSPHFLKEVFKPNALCVKPLRNREIKNLPK